MPIDTYTPAYTHLTDQLIEGSALTLEEQRVYEAIEQDFLKEDVPAANPLLEEIQAKVHDTVQHVVEQEVPMTVENQMNNMTDAQLISYLGTMTPYVVGVRQSHLSQSSQADFVRAA